VTRSERLAEKLKADRAARRHVEYVEKQRSERAELAAIQKRLQQDQEKRRARLPSEVLERILSERQELRRSVEVEGQVAKTVRAQQRERRLAEERPGRGQPRKMLPPRSLEEHQRLGKAAEAARQRSVAQRQQQAEQRRMDRAALNHERAQLVQIREGLGAQRVEEHRQSRAAAETARQRSAAQRQQQAEQRRIGRAALDHERAQLVQIREGLGAQRVEEHRQLRAAAEGARQRSAALRQQQGEQRRMDRTALDRERAERVQIREELGTRRLREHRQLQKVADAAKRQGAALRTRAEARRFRRGKTTVARPPAARLAEIRGRAALASPAPPLEEPQDNLLWLRTADSFVVDENGAALSLRGITVQGLDAAAPAANQSVAATISLDDENLSAISDLWAINLVRLPLKAQTILSGNNSLSGTDLLAAIDDIVAALGQLGIYTLLSLQAPVSQGETTAPLPDQSAFDCWGLLAQHYQDEPAVLFEIFSSPLPISGDWFSAAQRLIGFIRRQHPASLLFVGNGSGTVDTSGLPLRFTTGDPTPNIVHTIRVAPQTQFSTSDQNLLASLTHSFPVLTSDWSSGASGFDRSAEFTANLFSRYGIGWAASNWNGEPRLVTNSDGHNFSPTRWGLAVQRAMTLPKKEPLEMLLPGEESNS